MHFPMQNKKPYISQVVFCDSRTYVLWDAEVVAGVGDDVTQIHERLLNLLVRPLSEDLLQQGYQSLN